MESAARPRGGAHGSRPLAHPGTQNVAPHGTEEDCFVQVIDVLDGRILHLSTFGSDERTSEPKSIMALQFDRETALQLARVILDEFVE